MAPQSRTSWFPEVVIDGDTESEESSSSDADEEEVLPEETIEEESKKNKGKTPITISLKKVCKVCIPLFFFSYIYIFATLILMF